MRIEENIVLRRASIEDAELLFQWKNDKATIENSISKRGVTMEEHLKWLEKVIENPNRQLFIMDVDGTPVGQLRLDLEGSSAEISYGLGAEFRGKGLGRLLLEQAETLAEVFAISTLTAEVLPHNAASQKLFKSLGFEEEKREEIYVYRKQYR